ncbi:MAG: BON domain-containing protein [Candidatus Omnitrophota bacterium]|nr:BON domain-containing protein [Candidatus Omnitrophota bacterium]
MKKMFFLMVVISLPFVVFTVRESLGSSDAAQLSIPAEAVNKMEQANTTDSSLNALENAKAIPASAPPEIMGHNNDEGINRNYDAKSEFEKQADRALSLQVQQALTGNPQLAGKLANIKITAVEGSVILQGTVSSEDVRANIVQQIENMAGVDHVDNQLTIGSK